MRRVHLSGCGYSSRGLVAVHLSQVNLATVPLLIARVAQIIIARGTVVVGASAALATGITNPAGGVASLSVLSVLECVSLYHNEINKITRMTNYFSIENRAESM